jgi:DnaJ-class molecular chaperone
MLFQPIKKLKRISDVRIVYNSPPKVKYDTYGERPEWKECDRCNGSGNIPHPTKWAEGKQITCPKCHGAGNVKE